MMGGIVQGGKCDLGVGSSEKLNRVIRAQKYRRRV